MERNYRIELLDIASDNIDEIAVYIAKDLGNRRAAEKLFIPANEPFTKSGGENCAGFVRPKRLTF